jgi:MFS family permease
VTVHPPYGTDPSGNPLDRYGLSRPVWLLSWVSFFTDTASEMVYPLLPLFLTRVLGAGAMSLGVIEGVAEGANSILKIVSGWLADRWGTERPLVLFGYGLSSLMRPLIALVTSWTQVLGLRFVDRLGKGIRTSPRDAMLVRFAPPDKRGRVYGFHRAMDHAGAVTGPLVASAYLYFHPDAYRSLFAWTLVPGIIVILILLRVPEHRSSGDTESGTRNRRDQGRRTSDGGRRTSDEGLRTQDEGLKTKDEGLRTKDEGPKTKDEGPRTKDEGPGTRDEGLGTSFYSALVILVIFSLGNASDAFLLLRLADLGVAAIWIPVIWSALHVVKMTASVFGGVLSDRFGRRSLIAMGWLWYAVVYAVFGYADQAAIVVPVFISYGLYFGLTEGVEKAWIADMAPAAGRGVAFGAYNAAIGFGGLAASLLFGAIWTRVSPRAAFLTGAALALVASVLLYLIFSRYADGQDSRDQR